MGRQDRQTAVAIGLTLAAIVASTFSFVAPAFAQWNGFAQNPQHSAESPASSQALNRVVWSTPVDLAPQFSGGELGIHYGSPLVTTANTVIVPVKTTATGGFRVEARRGIDGTLIWTLTTEYVLPPHGILIPAFGPVLTSQPRLYFPGIGGTVYFRNNPDVVCSSKKNCQGQLAFFGMKNYRKRRQAYNSSVMINTPLSADFAGNIFFGFVVIGQSGQPLRDTHHKILSSGLARIDARGKATWTPVTTASGDQTITTVVLNCAPALSPDLNTVYVAVSNGSAGYLLALDSHTLGPISRVRLKDPKSGNDASLAFGSSATPTVGPDGDVYYGVLENPCCVENHDRGWLLHFNGGLTLSKIPGAFGWDSTASIVPSSMIPSYSGPSSYLLMSKYNNYAEVGGNGINKLAVLDPNASETDSVTGVTVMNEVETVVGVTPDVDLPGVKEWCINSGAIDPATGSVLVNSEDGKLYRWNLSSNTLSESVLLTTGLSEAYTPTVIGVDGTVYAINDATLFAVGQ